MLQREQVIEKHCPFSILKRILTLSAVVLQTLLKVVTEHYEEGHKNRFPQFSCDGATLKNKENCQAFGVQFTGKELKYNDAIASSFRKPTSNKADRIAELAEEMCDEVFDLKFQDAFRLWCRIRLRVLQRNDWRSMR